MKRINGFAKTRTDHAAAVSLYAAYDKICLVHEALRTREARRLENQDTIIYLL
jgi:hypothetical protein